MKKIQLPGVVVIALYFTAIMFLFLVWRGLWIWQLREYTATLETGLVFRAFGVALRLDMVVAAILTAPVLVIGFIPGSLKREWGRQAVLIWTAMTGLLIGTAMIVDIEYFREFDTHINLMVTQYGGGTQEIWGFFWASYPLVRYFLLLMGLTGLWWLGITRLLQRIHVQAAKPRWLPIPAFLLTLALLVIAGRGGLQERPVNWGNAIFSKNHFANQIALNPLYFFGRSVAQLADARKLNETLNFMSPDSAWQITGELVRGTDEYSVDAKIPLRRVRAATGSLRRPHVVLVILETFAGEYCGYLNPQYADITPHLDEIAAQGLTFQRCFANGHRTAHGLGAILCSWPNLPGAPVIYRVEAQREMPTAASILSRLGFETTFLYGGDVGFDNMGGFFYANGYDRILDKSAFPRETPATMWGVYDEYLFDRTLAILDTASTPQFLTVLTVSNHQPWTLPKHREVQVAPYENPDHPNADMLRTMRYVDLSIGEFLKSAQSRSWFDSTLFVFVSDHGRTLHQGPFHDPRNHRIVGLFYGPKLLGAPTQVTTVTSQVDILPTILGVLNDSSVHTLWGRNRRLPGPDYAGMLRNERFDWYTDGYFYEEILGENGRLYQYGDDWNSTSEDVTESNPEIYQQLRHQAHGYLQAAYFGFEQRVFTGY
ncbi:MAG: sulfatase-like hydrolase/transferase [Lentisphaeria bacterium]|nr:sulfatase-like hydrolase/transferase [Candidatus Neomarinimicrobiota bacterium]MCF7842716.1 sulfatase-like hydrolase/transferase [Lentisphaeria bacterium]